MRKSVPTRTRRATTSTSSWRWSAPEWPMPAQWLPEGWLSMSQLTFETFAAAAKARGFDEVLERKWQPSLVLDTHTHPFAVKALVVQGEMWLVVGNDEQHLLSRRRGRAGARCAPHRALRRGKRH